MHATGPATGVVVAGVEPPPAVVGVVVVFAAAVVVVVWAGLVAVAVVIVFAGAGAAAGGDVRDAWFDVVDVVAEPPHAAGTRAQTNARRAPRLIGVVFGCAGSDPAGRSWSGPAGSCVP